MRYIFSAFVSDLRNTFPASVSRFRSAAPRHEPHPEYTQIAILRIPKFLGESHGPARQFPSEPPRGRYLGPLCQRGHGLFQTAAMSERIPNFAQEEEIKGFECDPSMWQLSKTVSLSVIACCEVSADGPVHPHRRTRCDGQPRCTHCVRRHEECTYVGHKDGRKTAAKEYVEMLESRIKQLEGERSTSSVEPTVCPLTEMSHLSPLNGTATIVQHEKSYQLSGEFTSVS